MTKTIKQENLYSTTDLSLATALSLYFPIEAIDRQNSKSSAFLFIRRKELDKLIESYWKDELKVSPRQYFNQLRDIKSRLYEK